MSENDSNDSNEGNDANVNNSPPDANGKNNENNQNGSGNNNDQPNDSNNSNQNDANEGNQGDGNQNQPNADEGSSGDDKSFFEKMFGKKDADKSKSFLENVQSDITKQNEEIQQQKKNFEDFQNGVLSKDLAKKAFTHLNDENATLKSQVDTLSTDLKALKEEISKGKGRPSGLNPFGDPDAKIDHEKLSKNRPNLL